MPTRAELAVEMIGRSASVLALRPGEKIPMTPRGFKDASPDPVAAATFLAQAGRPNYGIVWPDETNPIFPWDVDGGDGHHTWRDDWRRLNEQYGQLPLTLTTKTPSGGRHYTFRWMTELYGPHPEGDKLLGFTVRWPNKGYVVGPGSVVDGKTYETNHADIAEFPEAWAHAAIEEARKKPALRSVGFGGIELEIPPVVGEGGRYGAIRNYQAQLYNKGLTRDQILTLTRSELAPRFSPILGEAELLERFDRAWKDIDQRLGEPRAPGRSQALVVEDDFKDQILLRLPSGDFPADPDEVAFEGLAGEAVDALSSLTTASRVGLLASILTVAGASLAVTTSYYGIQPSAFMTALVGESGRGKKGTAMNAAWTALTADDAFGAQPELEIKGLGSGEGLVGHAVRALAGGERVARMLLMQDELGDALVVKGREGNTLGSYLRQGFDRVGLASITKGTSLVVAREQYQLGLLGGITPEELKELLGKTSDIANGFANRILWVPVQGRDDATVTGQRLTVLPHPLATGFAAAQSYITGVRHQPFEVDDAAAELLSDYYAFLSTIKGTPGVLTRRNTTIAARIALVHTVLDRARSITVDRVARAIALTEYSRSGLQWIFGASVAGSPDAERLLRVLLTAGRGMKRSDLATAAWRTHWNADRVDKALDQLQANNLVETSRLETPGRPATVIELAPAARGFTPFSYTRVREPAAEREPVVQGSLDELAEAAIAGDVVSREAYYASWRAQLDERLGGGNGSSDQGEEGGNRGGIGVGNPVPIDFTGDVEDES